MVNFNRWKAVDRFLGFDRHPASGHRTEGRHAWLYEEERALLPRHRNEQFESAVPAEEVTKTCLRLRHLIQECIPCEMDESLITTPHSRILTKKVVQAAKEAAGHENRSCVVFCLLVNKSWFKHEAKTELWDADLHELRAVACGVISKAIIESEEDTNFLLHAILLRRYSILSDGFPTLPTNVVEKAVDQHEIRIIGSSGYQKCIGYLWRGWLVQDEDDPSVFVEYKDRGNTNFRAHLDPDRMRAPIYQNMTQMLMSIIYLVLYTAAINSINAKGYFDAAEITLYLFTVGFICDECLKVYKAGHRILGFWNVLNGMLYTFLTASFILRVIGLSHPEDTHSRVYYSTLSYNLLASVAPMFWCRLLLYLDSFRFFGAMLVVLKVMMKESVIFFALLIMINIGFLQAFIGLDLADNLAADDVWFIVQQMCKVVLQSPDFDNFEKFGHPFGLILHYCFTFIVMVVLLNILIALYNSAYEDIYTNADNEYLALLSQKTMQFVRAPDENVYIAPFNLIEIIVSALFEWWMSRKHYEYLNDAIMAILYSPVLLFAAFFETRRAHDICQNRARGDADDDVEEEWEQMASQLDFESDGWTKTCEAVKSNVEEDPAITELKHLRTEVDELKAMLAQISQAVGVKKSGSEQEESTKGKGKSNDEDNDGDGYGGSSSSTVDQADSLDVDFSR